MARHVRGDIELQRALRAIPDRTVRGLDSVAKPSLEPMRRQIQLNAMARRQAGRAPAGGHLDQGVVTRKVRNRGKHIREFWISLTRRARSIGHLVELGTAPHWQPKRRRMHPGAKPFPFFAPGFEDKKHVVVAEIARRTWQLISTTALSFGKRVR